MSNDALLASYKCKQFAGNENTGKKIYSKLQKYFPPRLIGFILRSSARGGGSRGKRGRGGRGGSIDKQGRSKTRSEPEYLAKIVIQYRFFKNVQITVVCIRHIFAQ